MSTKFKIMSCVALCGLSVYFGFFMGMWICSPRAYEKFFARSKILKERGMVYGLPWEPKRIGLLFSYNSNGNIREILYTDPFANRNEMSLLWRWDEQDRCRLISLPLSGGTLYFGFDSSGESASGRVEWVPNHPSKFEYLRIEVENDKSIRVRRDQEILWQGKCEDFPESLDRMVPAGGIRAWVHIWTLIRQSALAQSGNNEK